MQSLQQMGGGMKLDISSPQTRYCSTLWIEVKMVKGSFRWTHPPPKWAMRFSSSSFGTFLFNIAMRCFRIKRLCFPAIKVKAKGDAAELAIQFPKLHLPSKAKLFWMYPLLPREGKIWGKIRKKFSSFIWKEKLFWMYPLLRREERETVNSPLFSVNILLFLLAF